MLIPRQINKEVNKNCCRKLNMKCICKDDYTELACRSKCLSELQAAKCNCTHYLYPKIGKTIVYLTEIFSNCNKIQSLQSTMSSKITSVSCVPIYTTHCDLIFYLRYKLKSIPFLLLEIYPLLKLLVTIDTD